MRLHLLVLFTCAALISSAAIAATEPGVSATEIRIGCAVSKTGGAAEYGNQMSKAMHAYFDKVNAQGGVFGRKIVFLDRDDGYEPMRSNAVAKELIEKDGIFALVGGLGSSQQKALVPLVDKNKIPMIFPMTGIESLRDPVNPQIFNLQISYREELETAIDFAAKQLGIKEFGLLYQDDALGDAGREAIGPALKKHNLTLVRSANYQRNTVDVAKAVTSLKESGVKAVYIQGTAPPALAFVKEAAAQGFKPVYLGPSIIGNERFAASTRDTGAKIYTSGVVPLPSETKYSIIRQYREDMATAGITELTSFGVESYLMAVIFVDVLKRTGPNLTREALRATLEGVGGVSYGGLDVSFGPKQHQGLHHGFINQVVNGVLTPVEVR